jgi:hypothetical protein
MPFKLNVLLLERLLGANPVSPVSAPLGPTATSAWRALSKSEVGSYAFLAHPTFDTTAQCAPINCKVGANSRGINEADWLGLAALDGGKPRERALVVFVLVLVEPQSTAEADRRRKFWL